MINIIITKSKNKLKKYDAIINNKKKISFGSSKYESYPEHKNEIRKQRYILRHEKNENWNDYMTPGFWSRWLLWNKSTIKDSLKDIKNKYPNLDIKMI